MATKKTASKTPESASIPAEKTPKPVAKKAAKKAAEKKVPAKTAAKTATPAAAKKAPAKKAAAKPSLDVIARAAYLNYRRRVELGLPGDSHGDWLEAERQFSEPV
jgi:outer membrane biosynthesis protein TonB